jgi:hypothetical protein
MIPRYTVCSWALRTSEARQMMNDLIRAALDTAPLASDWNALYSANKDLVARMQGEPPFQTQHVLEYALARIPNVDETFLASMSQRLKPNKTRQHGLLGTIGERWEHICQSPSAPGLHTPSMSTSVSRPLPRNVASKGGTHIADAQAGWIA